MDATALTIIFIVLSALVAIFVRRVTRDRCLKDFAGNTITLEKVNGKMIYGKTGQVCHQNEEESDRVHRDLV